MNREELEELEATLTDLIEDRRRLGGFDTNAGAILDIAMALRLLTHHLREEANAKGKQRKR